MASRVEVGVSGQDASWGVHETRRYERKQRNPPHSLIISPNLDALLEFDEKARGAWPISPTREPPQSSAPPVEIAPVGLPPPPRRNRKPLSPTSPKVGSPLIQEYRDEGEPGGSPTSNPYINPAPSLDEILLEAEDDVGRNGRFSSPETADGGNGQGIRSVDLQQLSNVSLPSTATPTTKKRVDKLLGIGKIPFALFSDTNSPKDELNDVSNSPNLSRLPALNLRERARAKGKLLKLKDPNLTDSNSNPQPEMRQTYDETVLDIRRQKSELRAWTPPGSDNKEQEPDESFPQRLLLSHDSWLPSSRRSSSDSSSSSSTTQGPASTIDPRISISSTIYPASSAHSHPHDMYNTAELPIVPPYRTSSLHQPPTPLGNTRNTDRESFIDILSPDVAEFTLPELTDYSVTSQPSSRTSSPKPPIPTAPKPMFNRASPRTSPHQRYDEPKKFSGNLPPTTNFLDLDERSDLIRKNRKLARVFGQSPGPDAFLQQDAIRSNKPPVLPTLSSSSNNRHPRGALSVSDSFETEEARISHPPWPPAAGTQYLNSNGRRHSLPLSPDEFSFLKTDTIVKSSRYADNNATDEISPTSPTSFIDLSDDLGSATLVTPKKSARGRPSSPSSQSLFENMSPEEQAEEGRRRKREKLAKLHRFLGSRVPANLVLGLDDETESSLPPPGANMATLPENGDVSRRDWLRRRRSSSAAAYSSSWSDEIDRIKEDLDLREKAINVRRAQKMEKVFGIAPPQTLYHTRRSPSPSVSNAAATTGHKMASGWSSGDSPTTPGHRNPNRSSYQKSKSKKEHRPGTSESNKLLLPKGRSDSADFAVSKRRTSVVYSHYQESLNSLNDIIDHDDKESLAELHEYLNSGDMTIPPPLQSFTRAAAGGSGDRRLSIASSTKSERRRSLPARTSIISIASEYSIATPRPEVTDFQARRRRAAKLTQFFGVDYRELISDVLESIEHGLEHERKRGTLKPDEVEDLLARLRNLRTKRGGAF